MRSVLFKIALVIFVLMITPIVWCQINPGTNINWPSSCSDPTTFYQPGLNVCSVPAGGGGGGGGGGGLPVLNPTFLGTLTGPVGNFGNAQQTRANLNIPTISLADNYGAVSDAQSVGDGVMSSGSTTLTSAACLFAPSDVGKVISIQGAGSATAGDQQPLVTTIASYVATGTVTVTSPALKAVSATGVIWGTDNYNAFANFMAALPNHTGMIPYGNYLVDTRYGTRQLNLASNETISMDPNGTIFFVGAKYLTHVNLFNFPVTSTGIHNVRFVGLHVKGEWINTSNRGEFTGGWGYATAIGVTIPGSGVNSWVWVTNCIFENLLGIGVMDLSLDERFFIDNNVFRNMSDTGTNVIDAYGSVSYNLFDNVIAATENNGSGLKINHNTSIGGGIIAGGITSGPTNVGLEIIGNTITNVVTPACILVDDGVSKSIVANNTCTNPQTGNTAGIEHLYQGYVPTSDNVISGNYVSAVDKGIVAITVNNDLIVGNIAYGAIGGVVISTNSNSYSIGNLGSGAVGDIGVEVNGVITSKADVALHGNFHTELGGTFSPESILSIPGNTVFANLLQAPFHTPSSSAAPCTQGQFADDANYHYVCVVTGDGITTTPQWKRIALSTF